MTSPIDCPIDFTASIDSKAIHLEGTPFWRRSDRWLAGIHPLLKDNGFIGLHSFISSERDPDLG
jgi:hypothetical protein